MFSFESKFNFDKKPFIHILDFLEEKDYPLRVIVNDFHSWMTDHERITKKRQDTMKIIKKLSLIGFFSNYGYRFIEDYSHFCEVSEALSKKGYLTNPPPSQDDLISLWKSVYNVFVVKKTRGRNAIYLSLTWLLDLRNG